MAWPGNAQVLQGMAKTSFYGALQTAEEGVLYPKVCEIIDQQDLTVTYTSFGGVPEPRQLSGASTATGQRMAKSLNDYTLTATVIEWEDTVTIPRSVIETNPGEIPRITTQMAQKAALFMDRRFIATALPSTTALGYDGSALYHASNHTETGTAQDNARSTAVTGISATHPTSSEFEMLFDDNISRIKNFTDDAGTPVNAAAQRFTLIVPTEFEYHIKSLVGAGVNSMVAGGVGSLAAGVDIVTSRFRGMIDVYGSPFIATQDRIYWFVNNIGPKAVALIKNKDWEFKTNIGTDSDLWNYSQTALFTAYARFEFVPWNWKNTLRQIYT